MKRIVGLAKRVSAINALCTALTVISPAQTFTTLFSFDRGDGANPSGGLIQTANGEFYGTTQNGGAYYGGTVFKITPSGRLMSPDGALPRARLFQARDGNFYGTTAFGGTYDVGSGFLLNYGTVFKITPNGALTALYSFCAESDCTDGEMPIAGLVQAASGEFYGTTFLGGGREYGAVFRLSPE